MRLEGKCPSGEQTMANLAKHVGITLGVYIVCLSAGMQHSYLVFLGGLLIDVDHYLWYIIKFRKINIIKCYHFFQKDRIKKKYRNKLLIFHSRLMGVLITLASVYMHNAPLILGYIAHIIIDEVWEEWQ